METNHIYNTKDKAPPKDGTWFIGIFNHGHKEGRELILCVKWNKKRRAWDFGDYCTYKEPDEWYALYTDKWE